jgi:glutamine amidotransferase
MRATIALSDGVRIHALRYASDGHPPSLYHRLAFGGTGRIVTSEPLDADNPAWIEVPPDSFLTVERERIEVQPFRPGALTRAA